MCGQGGVAGAAIPAELQGKYRQAIAASTGERMVYGLLNVEWRGRQEEQKLGAEKKELRARIEALEWKEGEGVQGGQGLPLGRESGLEEEWGMEMDLEDESCKKLDEQRRKLQKELRDVQKFSCVAKEFQENLKSNLQQQLQEVEQRRHDFMPEHLKVQTHRKRFKASRTKKFAERQYRSRRGDAEAPRGAQAKRGAHPFSVEQSR